MIRSRFSLLGVLLAAIGLMAVFASAAQAEVGAKWLVLTKNAKEELVLLSGAEIEANNEEFKGELVNKTKNALLSEIGTTKIAVKCEAGELINALLNATGGVKKGGKVKFTSCTFRGEGTDGLLKEFPKCVPKTNKGPSGTVETLAAHALLKLDGSEDTVLILPDNETTQLATTLELGASCAFGEELPIFGSLAVKDTGGNTKALEHLKSRIITEYAATTTLAVFAVRGQAGSKVAKVDGEANIFLGSGRLWSGDPA